MPDPFRLKLKLWGVRGSTPTPQSENLEHGGNTSCLELRIPTGEVFIFDAGTGLRGLGKSLAEEFPSHRMSLHLFLTHFHWDHIQGLPFFAPLYTIDSEVIFHSGHAPGMLEEILEGQMRPPYFPVDFDMLRATRHFAELDSWPFRQGDLTIHSFPLNHPQGACGYRIESQGAVIVYATDLEHGDARLDAVLREYSQGADILVYDAQFTPAEYESRRGWGHSTWLEATRVARDSKVKRLLLFHHAPDHSDCMLSQLVQEAQRQFENTIAAKEGLLLTL